ncbi:hypothetical protein DFH11DRAFT_1505255 [Phellopilus nigrolimitatus]|nr:hypothetical protein DFH11DRAFT_1505255 [Phellopilus nigrolimitatus]
MSSSITELDHFLIYAPYRTDEGIQQRRSAVIQEHLERIQRLAESKTLKVGGPLMDPESIASEEKRAVASCMIIVTPSYDAARKLIEEDPYYIGEVWDKEKLEITPFVFFKSFLD